MYYYGGWYYNLANYLRLCQYRQELVLSILLTGNSDILVECEAVTIGIIRSIYRLFYPRVAAM